MLERAWREHGERASAGEREHGERAWREGMCWRESTCWPALREHLCSPALNPHRDRETETERKGETEKHRRTGADPKTDL